MASTSTPIDPRPHDGAGLGADLGAYIPKLTRHTVLSVVHRAEPRRSLRCRVGDDPEDNSIGFVLSKTNRLSAERTAQAIMHKAKRHGLHDNTTVAVARIPPPVNDTSAPWRARWGTRALVAPWRFPQRASSSSTWGIEHGGYHFRVTLVGRHDKRGTSRAYEWQVVALAFEMASENVRTGVAATRRECRAAAERAMESLAADRAVVQALRTAVDPLDA